MRWIKRLAALCVMLPAWMAAQAVGPAEAPQVTPQFRESQFQVLIDAAHGGTDTGAHVAAGLEEKMLTLELANQLRSLLAARGFAVTTTRIADETLPADERAAIANRTRFAACILIHATATGSGVHLYTSSLAQAAMVKFMPWQTAQSGFVTESLKLASDMDSALSQAAVPVTLGRTALQPLDSMECPAVAVELAPLAAGGSSKAKAITDESYQQSIVNALAAAMEEWRQDWNQKDGNQQDGGQQP